MSHPHMHQPGSGRAAPPQQNFKPNVPQGTVASGPMSQNGQGAVQPQATPLKDRPDNVMREAVSDFGDEQSFKPGSAADALKRSLEARQETSSVAVEAVQGTPAPAPKPGVKKFTFTYPIDNGGSQKITEVTFKRPKWSEFQKVLRHQLVISGEMTDNDALISAVTGLNLHLIPEIDAVDGARLLQEVQLFFVGDLLDKPSAT